MNPILRIATALSPVIGIVNMFGGALRESGWSSREIGGH